MMFRRNRARRFSKLRRSWPKATRWSRRPQVLAAPVSKSAETAKKETHAPKVSTWGVFERRTSQGPTAAGDRSAWAGTSPRKRRWEARRDQATKAFRKIRAPIGSCRTYEEKSSGVRNASSCASARPRARGTSSSACGMVLRHNRSRLGHPARACDGADRCG